MDCYIISKRVANKAVSIAKYESYDDLYAKLETKEGEKGIYRLAKVREMQTKELDHVRWIRDEIKGF